MSITEYVIPLGENARKRHYHETDKYKVTSFVVQMEVFINGQWKVVIRYDCAHGFPHLDQYHLDGRKIKKKLNLEMANRKI